MKTKKSDRGGINIFSVMGVILVIVALGISVKLTVFNEPKNIEEIGLSDFKGKILSYHSYQECLNKEFLPMVNRDDQFYQLLNSEGSYIFYDPNGANPIVVSKIDTLKVNGLPVNLRQLLSQKRFDPGFDYILSYKYDQNKIIVYKKFGSILGEIIGVCTFFLFIIGLIAIFILRRE